MKFTISREAFLKPLVLVAGVVERRQTLPVLANILVVVEGDQLTLTGTDLEVELVGRVSLDQAGEDGSVTIPARKLMDICKSLPDHAMIEVAQTDEHVLVRSARSRFKLSTLPAADFPNVEDSPESFEFEVPQMALKQLVDQTGFAMAQQDVRYYLNGMLFEVSPDYLRVVSTDGHRLAMETLESKNDIASVQQLILPRKGVMELARLLEDEGDITLVFGQNHIRAAVADFTFTSKLVDGKFPDYNRVLPKGGNKVILGDCQALKQGFSRASILSNEKYRGVRLKLSADTLDITANNPEQEQAEEVVAVEYQGEELEVGFNVSYLLDVLSVLDGDQIRLSLSDSASSALLEEADEGDSLYVVMPMRL